MIRWLNVRAMYQIYPRSFLDTNGDGVGDLPGVIAKLDYLKGQPNSLGIDAIWISPFYPSPMADFGYDISDYRGVHPLFGTMTDFERLIGEAHQRDIKVMIDFVPNHTSDEHEWFVRSRSSRDDERRDWYVWRDPAPGGGPPNNWLSVFGGSAWTFDEASGQYYLHSFLDKQPDLNWSNPRVRQAMGEVLRFWMGKGVDGFRMDAVRWMSKDANFRDNPPNPEYDEDDDPYLSQLQIHSRFGPKLFTYLKELSDVVESYDDRIVIFEDYPDSGPDHISQYLDFYEQVNPAIASPFNYDGIHVDYEAQQIRDFITLFQNALDPSYRPVYALGNHDQPRLASRMGRDQALLMAVLLLTLPGLPVLYYGDELGMRDVPVPPDEVHDPFEKQQPGKGLGRDPERSPMQWNTDTFAGFSQVKPWLPVADDAAEYNVERQQQDKTSFLHVYQTLLALRHESAALRSGLFHSLVVDDERLFVFTRRYESETLMVILNISSDRVTYHPESPGVVVLSTNGTRVIGAMLESIVELAHHEALIVRL